MDSNVGLEWVLQEIDSTLNSAKEHISAYVENELDPNAIVAFKSALHTVKGSLEILEISATAMLLEEMIELASALENQTVKDVAPAVDAVIEALLGIPLVLDQIKRSEREPTLKILSHINDLRSARQAGLLTTPSLFNPDLHIVQRETDEKITHRLKDPKVRANVTKLHHIFQHALGFVLKQDDFSEHVQYLKKVAEKLIKFLKGSSLGVAWEVAHTFFDAIDQPDKELTLTIKNLLKEIDDSLGDLSKQAHPKVDLDLVKNLLFYVAESSNHTAQGEKLLAQFGLQYFNSEDLADDSATMDRETLLSLVTAIQDELNVIKTGLDEYEPEEWTDELWQESIVEPCAGLANTFSLLGFNVARKILLDLTAGLSVDTDRLAKLAEGLVYIDTYLEGFKASPQMSEPEPESDFIAAEQRSQAITNIYVESKKEIESIKLTLSAMIGKTIDSDKLGLVQTQIGKLNAVLKFSGHEDALDIIDACLRFASQLPSDQTQDARLTDLGDTLVCLEFLLEQLAQGISDNQIVMRHARLSMQQLIEHESSTNEALDDGDDNELIDSDILEVFAEELNEVTEEIKVVVEALRKDASDANDLLNLRRHFHTLKGSGNLVGASEVATLAKAYEDLYNELISLKLGVEPQHVEIAETFLSLSNQLVDNFAKKVSTPETQSLIDKIDTLRKSLASDDSDDIELVDQDILDIFIEESDEVLEAISGYLKAIALPHPDMKQVTELRRAFHTLKGSGRLVGATHPSDLAWAVENLLNRILDESISLNAESLEAVIDARSVMPDLLLAFKNSEAIEPAQDLINRCDLLSRGESIAKPDPVEETIEQTDQLDIEAGGTLDTSLVEIFKGETQGHIETLMAFIDNSRQDDSVKVTEAVGRAFHTLKGSANTAKIGSIAGIVVPFEAVVKAYRARDLQADKEFISLLEDIVETVQQAINELSEGTDVALSETQSLLERINLIAEKVEQIPSEDDEGEPQRDEQLINTFLNESMDLMFSAEQLMDGKNHETLGREDLEILWSTLSKVRNGARVIELVALSELSNELALAYESLSENDGSLRNDDYQVLVEAHEQVIDYLNQTAAGLDSPSNLKLLKRITSLRSHWEKRKPAATPEPAEEPLVSVAEELPSEESVTVEADRDQSIQQVFQEELTQVIESIHAHEKQIWSDDAFDQSVYESIRMSFHTMKGSARLAEESAIANACAALENLFESAIAMQHAISLDLMRFIFDELKELAHLEDWKEDSVLLRVADYMASLQSSDIASTETSELDSELIGIYLEEARDIIDQSADLLRSWEKSPENLELVGDLQRQLHTLKGGARMAQVREIGDLSHEMETIFERVVQGQLKVSEKIISSTVRAHDGLATMVDQLATHEPIANPSDLIALCKECLDPQSAESEEQIHSEAEKASQSVEGAPQKEASETTVSETATEPAPEKAPKAKKASPAAIPTPAAQPPAEAKRANPQETIRVSAPLLDNLVNLAGETSISRGRIEQEISDFAFTLEEMASTIDRLREQLRRMDMETEAQILFRAEKEGFKGPAHDDFDPLEMDRYSTIQQLSRGLSESASDLLELRESLSDKARDAETVLLQQSRINSELQEGLMKTRMIPFSSMVPRLRRIVRQVSGELNKQVEFEVLNADGEMDRTILERMIAPLEHMLRNAVDHGIESKKARADSGKPAMGTITLSFAREGGDIVLTLKDDGAGIDLDKVKQKAIKQKLIPKNSRPKPQDILQFIMQPGFSTASKVTQISGRGVGMDVVASEIKQIGGTIDIESEHHQGTSFEVRLPFTVSVNRALMVKIGDDFYAIPLNTIEGIVRVSAYELDAYYSGEAKAYEYAGQKYRLQYLGRLLNSEHQPKLQGQPLPLPVILVRGADKPMALQVDSLMGSREIVVKNLGPQFARVQGVSGATILGDGHVVVILDLPALIREHQSHKPAVKSEVITSGLANFRSKQVMVIDDSVTVRKVTSRLLERNGFEVITAKDGVDAIAMLQDHLPDILLLDIEMPRMDGFEVATLVRHDDRLKNVPIVMITSRTGQKHRERALAIGVNEYIGKPFQEQDLLELITHLTETHIEKSVN